MITLYNILDSFKSGDMYSDSPVYSKTGKFRSLSNDITVQLSNNQTLTIKSGFVWDENSIPWILQPFFPKSGLYAPSALIHDALYYLTAHDKSWVEREYVKWMLATGVSIKQIIFRYIAVSIFGWRWWKRNQSHPSKLCQDNRMLLSLL
jgi:hypothetical protein